MASSITLALALPYWVRHALARGFRAGKGLTLDEQQQRLRTQQQAQERSMRTQAQDVRIGQRAAAIFVAPNC
ncbi:hypothetical protein [Dyella nitratireducens]|uniref:Uncharacterized protein n=1 Tax=Dyella nitratireducens TaxID=1849580 RepID=A0ABQ1GS42_9GAMM|nr:hypothetical protein [Dyella nitratireducens]GGA49063.1 hypothetical protein GCM10010981_42940 [Dyella nitratireducens]GLQ42229.1 hypothetical protein GCM10007902_20790 [Dyella nitratireducens]